MALGRVGEAAEYARRRDATWKAFQSVFLDEARGVYRDGEGTDHASLHANLFPLAFGLAPRDRRERVLAFVRSKGMACSPYAAQYLLEALFENDADDAALALMTAPGDRSWAHMLASGTTVTWEAWDQKYKPNQDWNHAWGAAPANLLSRYVLGVQPEGAGWRSADISPHPGSLAWAEGKVPTPRGPITVKWSRGDAFRMRLALPPGVSARLALPAEPGTAGLVAGGRAVPAKRIGNRWVTEENVTGTVTIEVR